MQVTLGTPRLVDVAEEGTSIAWSMTVEPPPGMPATGEEHEEWVEIEASVELEPRPDRYWLLFWQDEDLDWPERFDEPVLDGETLRFSAPEDELQNAWDAIKRRVAATNEAYAEHLSAGGRRPDDRHGASRLYGELLERAQRRVDELT